MEDGGIYPLFNTPDFFKVKACRLDVGNEDAVAAMCLGAAICSDLKETDHDYVV